MKGGYERHLVAVMGAARDDDDEGDDDGGDGGDAKHVDDVEDEDYERHLDTVMGAAGEATENTLSGMGGQ